MAIPKRTARNAATSLEKLDFANVIIMGLMVWKFSPPTIRGADMAPSPVRNVRMVIAKNVGFNTGMTIWKKILLPDAPIFFAASMVW